MNSLLSFAPEVRAALEASQPVVALESRAQRQGRRADRGGLCAARGL